MAIWRRAAIVVSMVALSVAGGTAWAEDGQSNTSSIDEVKAQLDKYAQEQVDLDQELSATQTRLDNTQAMLAQTRNELVDRQAKVDELNNQVVQIALQQWQTLGIDSTMVLLASESVEDMMVQLTTTQWMASTTADLLQQYQLEQAALADLEKSQTAAIAQIEDDKARVQQLADEANQRVQDTQRILQRLSAQERDAIAYAQIIKTGQPFDRDSLVSSTGMIWPVKGNITSPYGPRVHPIYGTADMHDGTDIAAPCGTPVVAVANGGVLKTEWAGGYGYRVIIDHGTINGQHIVTSYNHLSAFAVPEGILVNQGQVVAYVGATGLATGCHVHYMTWVNGNVVDSGQFL